MEGPEEEEVLGPPPMIQSSEENPPPPLEAGEADILSCELMEDREAAKGSRLPVSPALSPSSVAGEDEKPLSLEPVAAANSGVAGGDDSLEEETIQIPVDAVVERQEEPALPGSPAVFLSSSGEEDEKAPILETDVAAIGGDAGGDDLMEEDFARMAVDMVESQEDLPCPNSPLESPSSFAVDDKGPDFWPDAATTSGIGGGDDAVEEGATKMAMEPQDEPHRLGSPSSAGGGEKKKDLAIETDEATISPVGDGDAFVEEEDEQIAVEAAESPVGRVRRGGGRWKRGRPQKAHVGRAPVRRKEEEEVCFICFDGGDLVVCDRRGCPKVYHPSCVNRDEAFFRAKGRWNCGWHICNICQKSSHYMCYTCTYSLCKGCIRAARFICVRGTKGFCETCMSTVMLIETNEHGNEKTDRVDFDDKSSWEFLFKDYWLDLKGKLSLTLEELKKARTPQKDSSLISYNVESSDDLCDAKNDQQASSDSSSGHPEERISLRKKNEESNFAKKKGKKRSRKTANKEDLVKEHENTGTSSSKDISWASDELLEFVAHMKDGDISELSQFDVQALLLEYIKRNNLRDRRRKSQIICDSRLENLFGKSRVGHFEMLKLLESHFLMKEASPLDTDDNQGGVVDPDPMDVEGNSDASVMTSDNRRKSRRKVEEKEPQTNLDDFAAIDVHNIRLVYLRRNLMEDLLDDIDTFNEKVVGSFVRIRICSVGQRQDVYRLVQVKGTCKATDKYKSGKKTTDVMLEILNLDKTEVITIDIISNQEFTEEECKRLRQSIKCGFISRLTVGEVQEKARALQAVRVNDWLENEKLRLGHLRDRASEKGRSKELRECVEKLRLLNMPEHRNRRLSEVPEIHADPNMSPDYETAEEEEEPDGKRQEHADHYSRSRASAFFRKGKEVTSPGRGISISGDNWNGSRKNSNIGESNRSIQTEGASNRSASRVDVTNESSWKQGNDVHQTRSWEPPTTPANATGLEAGAWNNNQHSLRPGQSSGVQPGTPTASLSAGVAIPSNASESEKIWHYQDPSGKIQGPFSMMQLRKWNTTGYFPANLRIWRTVEKQEDSILLTDALSGKFRNDLPQHEPAHNNSTDNKQNLANWKASRNDVNLSTPGINESAKADWFVTRPSALSAPKTEAVNPNDGLGTSLRDRGSSKATNAWPGQIQGWSGARTTASFTGSPYQPLSHQSRGSQGGNSGRWNGSQDHGSNWGSNKPMGSQPTGQVYDKAHPLWSSKSQQSSEDMSQVQASEFSNQWKNDSFNLPTAPQLGSRDSACEQGGLNKSLPSSAPVQPMISGWGIPPSGNEAHQTSSASGMPNKTTMSDSVGAWGSSAVSHMLKQTVTADGGNPHAAAMTSMPNTAEVVETMGSSQLLDKVDDRGNFQISSQQKMSPAHESSLTLENISSLELPCRDEVILPSTDTQLAGGLDKDQCPNSDYTRPTPRSEQVSGDILSSECSETVPSQSNDRQDHPVVRQGQHGLGKKWVEAHDSLADKSGKSLVDGKGSVPGSVVDAHDTKLITEFDALEPESAQQSEISSSPNLGSESLGWASYSAPKQKPDSLCPNPAFTENRLEQNQSQMPNSSLAGPECINYNNLGLPSDGKSIEHLMPPPAIKIISSEWSGGASSTIGNNQNVQLVTLDGSKPWASSQCASASVEPAQPSNAGLSAVAHVQNTFWGVAPQNPNVGPGPLGNANMNWATTIQGNMNMGWGLIAQSNMNASQGTPAQGFANLDMGLGTPPQANMVVNAGWVPAAPGNANANPAWGTPFQGNPNLGTGWGAQVQGSMMVNPGWGTFPQGNMNPNPGFATPISGNANQNASWGAPTQGNMDTNSKSSWGSGQGNMNPTWDPSVGDLNSRSTPQAQAGDRHSDQSGSDSRHAAGRPVWNRIQSSGGGGSSRHPLRGQRGICRFHENGHCKKGASCNYIHS